jgi:hypothetical protein
MLAVLSGQVDFAITAAPTWRLRQMNGGKDDSVSRLPREVRDLLHERCADIQKSLVLVHIKLVIGLDSAAPKGTPRPII